MKRQVWMTLTRSRSGSLYWNVKVGSSTYFGSEVDSSPRSLDFSFLSKRVFDNIDRCDYKEITKTPIEFLENGEYVHHDNR